MISFNAQKLLKRLTGGKDGPNLLEQSEIIFEMKDIKKGFACNVYKRELSDGHR